MRERVHLCGGTFGAGSLPNGGFQVTAALPLPALAVGAPARPRAEAGFGTAGRTVGSAARDSAAGSRAAAAAAPAVSAAWGDGGGRR
jgi:hypothetical protein